MRRSAQYPNRNFQIPNKSQTRIPKSPIERV